MVLAVTPLAQHMSTEAPVSYTLNDNGPFYYQVLIKIFRGADFSKWIKGRCQKHPEGEGYAKKEGLKNINKK